MIEPAPDAISAHQPPTPAPSPGADTGWQAVTAWPTPAPGDRRMGLGRIRYTAGRMTGRQKDFVELSVWLVGALGLLVFVAVLLWSLLRVDADSYQLGYDAKVSDTSVCSVIADDFAKSGGSHKGGFVLARDVHKRSVVKGCRDANG